jgi:hypothetical protein
MTQTCPLCGAPSVEDFYHDGRRSYLRCDVCALIHADPASHLSPAEEKARYSLHQNDPQDPGYRRFLSRLAEPLTARLGAPPLRGLDFGSGPGPTLSVMMEERGYQIAVYDPYFAPDPAALQERYDFVTCTETLEHFHTPCKEWRLLLNLVKPGGWLGIMTRMVEDTAAFGTWYYKDDPTHVSFFSRATFGYLAARDGLAVEFVGNDVILLATPRRHGPGSRVPGGAAPSAPPRSM